MEILNFLSSAVDTNKFLKSCLAFNFSGIKSRDCKIQVKSKPTVIYALNRSRYFFFVIQQVTYCKYHSS